MEDAIDTRGQCIHSFFFSFIHPWIVTTRHVENESRQRQKRKQRERRARLRLHMKLRNDRRRKFLLVLAHFVLFVRRPSVRTIWSKPRSSYWWNNVNNTWTHRDWLENMRMCKDTFQYICTELRPYIERKKSKFRLPITVEQRVGMTLWRLATNVELRTISHLFGVGISTACHAVNEVCFYILVHLKSKYICIPGPERMQEISAGFEDRWGFPQCVGAIDGSHIPIIGPSDSRKDYFNRKGYFSVILQGVVDHAYRFWDTSVGWPGSMHDARVLGKSKLYAKGQQGHLFPHSTRNMSGVEVPLFLIGDAAYPLLPWIMKPYPGREDNLSENERVFNFKLSRARMVVENAFGRLKARWRILIKRIDSRLHNVPNMVVACCVLHNLCEVHKADFDQAWIEQMEREIEHHGVQQPQQFQHADNRAPAQALRQTLMLWLTT